MPISEPCPETTLEQVSEHSREDLVPLNLSKRNLEMSPSDDRVRGSDGEELKRGESPLNLCLRSSIPSSTWSMSEELQQRQEADLDEELCDQRQTAALALCQLASASSGASSCDFEHIKSPSEDCTEARIPSSIKKTKQTTKAKATSLKRANSDQTKTNGHKTNKRTKVPGWVGRRRPRCC